MAGSMMKRLKELEAEKKQRQMQRRQPAGGRQRQSAGEAMIKSAARSIGSTIGRQIRWFRDAATNGQLE